MVVRCVVSWLYTGLYTAAAHLAGRPCFSSVLRTGRLPLAAVGWMKRICPGDALHEGLRAPPGLDLHEDRGELAERPRVAPDPAQDVEDAEDARGVALQRHVPVPARARVRVRVRVFVL